MFDIINMCEYIMMELRQRFHKIEDINFHFLFFRMFLNFAHLLLLIFLNIILFQFTESVERIDNLDLARHRRYFILPIKNIYLIFCSSNIPCGQSFVPCDGDGKERSEFLIRDQTFGVKNEFGWNYLGFFIN